MFESMYDLGFAFATALDRRGAKNPQRGLQAREMVRVVRMGVARMEVMVL